MKKLLASLGLGAALAFATPSTSEAQGPVITGGLVNVTITNVANNNEIIKNVNLAVTAALNVAANICGVSVDVLATDFAPDGFATCTNTVTGRAVTLQRQ